MTKKLDVNKEVVQLRAQVAALEQLLNVYEQTTTEQFEQLEQTLAESEMQTQRLNLLNNLGTALNEATTLNEVFNITAARAKQIVNTDRASITLLNPDGQSFMVYALEDDTNAFSSGTKLTLDDTTNIGQAVRTKQIVITRNIQERTIKSEHVLAQHGFRMTMVIPLLTGGKAIGTLNIASRTADIYSVQEQELMLQTASLLAATIENRRLFTQIEDALKATERNAHRLAQLNEMSHQLNLVRTEAEVFNVAARQVAQIFTGDRGSVTLLNETGDQLNILALKGNEAIPLGASLPVESTLAGTATRQNRILINSDFHREEYHDYIDVQMLLQQGIQSCINAPLVVEGEPIGTLNVGSEKVGVYSTQDEGLTNQMASLLSSAIERNRLFEKQYRFAIEIEEQARRLTLLNDLGAALAAAEDMDAVYQIIASRTNEIISGDRVTITLLNEAADGFTYYALHGEGAHVGELSLNDTLVGDVVRENQVRITADIEAVDRADMQGLVKQGFQAAIAAPLRVVGRPIGTLNIVSKQPNAYAAADEPLLIQIAALLGAAIESQRLLQDTRQALSEAEGLYRISRSLTQLPNRQEMAELVLTEYLKILDFPQGGVLILDDDQANGTLIAQVTDGQLVQPGLHIPVVGNPSMELMLKTKAPVMIEDAVHDKLLDPIRELVNQLGYKSLLLVPIMLRGDIIGALGVDSLITIHKFTQREISLVQGMADLLGIALENQNLLHQAQNRAEQEQILRQVTEQVRSSVDADMIMRTAAREVGRVLGRPTFIYLDREKREEHQLDIEKKGA